MLHSFFGLSNAEHDKTIFPDPEKIWKFFPQFGNFPSPTHHCGWILAHHFSETDKFKRLIIWNCCWSFVCVYCWLVLCWLTGEIVKPSLSSRDHGQLHSLVRTPDHSWLCQQDLILKSPHDNNEFFSVVSLRRLKTDIYGRLHNNFCPRTVMNSVWTYGSQSESLNHSHGVHNFIIIVEITAH